MKKIKSTALAMAILFVLTMVISVFTACSGKNNSGQYVINYKEGMNYVETDKNTPEQVYKLTYDFIGGEDVMPIGVYWGPYVSGGSKDGNDQFNFSCEEIIKSFSECGINVVVHSNDTWITGSENSAIRNNIKNYNKYKIGYFPRIDWVTAEIGEIGKDVPLDKMQLSYPAGVEKLQNQINDILYDPVTKERNECILGLYGRDEPFTSMIDNFGVVSDVFYNKLQGVEGMDIYGNLLGFWEDENNLFGYSDPLLYEEYLRRIFEKVKLPMFSCTMYPYTSANTPEKSMGTVLYDYLSIYRKIAKELKIPMWRMLQAGGQWNDAQAWIPSVDPYPSEAETLYDVNLALCYGAKAIQYFPGIQPPWFAYEEGGTFDYNRCGLYGADGNKTQWYYYAKRANEQVKAADEYLMNAENVGVMVHGEKAREAFITNSTREKEEILKENKFRQLKEVYGDDCIVGCFDYNGGTLLYVVNYSRKEKANITLAFDKENYRYNVIQRGILSDVVGEKMELTLDAGEGALVVLY